MTARTRLGLLTALATGALLLIVGPAAAAPSPWWHLTQRIVPSKIEPEGEGTIVVQAINLGNAPTSGHYEISDTVPAGLELTGVELFAPTPSFFGGESPRPDLGTGGSFSFFEYCQQTPSSVTCSSQPGNSFLTPSNCVEFFGFDCSLKPVVPYDEVEMKLKVKAQAGFGPGLLESNQVSAAAGAAPPAQIERPVPLGDPSSVPFGLERFALTPEAEGGSVATRAGSHPYQLTTDVAFNRSNPNPFLAPAPPRNLHFVLPSGQLGNATITPKCSDADFSTSTAGGPNLCPANTVLGATLLTFSTEPRQELTLAVPVFNLQPAPGEPARFGFEALSNPVILDTHLRSGRPGTKEGDYGVTVDISNTTELVSFLSATTVFWGAPAAPSHNASRGWGCIQGGKYLTEGSTEQPCEPSTNPKAPAFLTLPTDCAAPFAPGFSGNSWPQQGAPEGLQAEPLTYPLQDEAGHPLGLTACNQVPFNPEISAEPTSDAATSPTGLNVAIDFHDEGLLNAEGIAQSQINKAIVTLPQGFTTNPSVAEGLKACTEAQYESETAETPPGGGCPNESKVGDVVIESPLVEEKVLGSIYVAQQTHNPNGNLLTLYLIAKNANLGVLVRQALKVTPDPVTGQLTTEVENVPELPFSHFQLSFRQGQRSPLVTPPACGTYTVAADLYPWARPLEAVHRESSFQITSGPESQGCPSGGVPPFHPGLEAGTQNNAAGTYSPFYTHITRKDSEQEITHFSIKLPPGVSGKLAGVAKCSDAQIAGAEAREHEGGGTEELGSPSCPTSSEIGHTLVGTGVGNVLAYAPGKLYLAGPYHGAPISIVSITAAKVGPFDLGTVVVREALKVNSETAEVFVDATGSDPIPHIVDGIPTHLRDIRIYVDRPEFVLNPTGCEKTSTASTVLGSGLDFVSEADDNPVTVSSPFQAADCAALGFKPKLTLQLKGGTRRSQVPALKATLTARKGDANIARSEVILPHSEFLEQNHLGTSCTRVQYNEGVGHGAGCPANSLIGRARAVTPILSEPLEGLVYLRSNGGERQVPDMVAALKSQEINIDLVGFIDSVREKNSHGETVSRIRNRFQAVPDAPVEKFTLDLFGGKRGLLVNSTDLCKGKHNAKVAFTAHNGRLREFKAPLKTSCPKKHGMRSKKKRG